MRARCGACGTEVEVMGGPAGGEFQCPSCGRLNRVAPAPAGAMGAPPPLQAAPEPQAAPSPRLSCPTCGFSFIVGDVEAAICPNCRAEVDVAPSTEKI